MRIEFEFPYDTRLSKNVWHVITGASGNKWDAFVDEPAPKGRAVINAPVATKLMGDVQLMARGQVNKYELEFKPIKTWVHIKVFKPDMKLDPCNVIGMIVDGIKRGIGIDDNLYAGSWDWELVTDESERIEIVVEQ